MRFNTRKIKSKRYDIVILSVIAAVLMVLFIISECILPSADISITGNGRFFSSTVIAETGTARPSVNGYLHVEGTQLVDENNEPVILKGISSHGLTWYPDFIDEKLFADLSEQWDCNLIRLAAYSSEYCKGYRQQTMDVLFRGIEAAIQADMYVLVDWHSMVDEDPNAFLEQADDFFSAVIDRYGTYPNLIYECCNEPGGDWSVIRNYCEEIIPVIREKDPDALIIIGTANYCQDLYYPSMEPVEFDNVMYSAHFYTASHGKELREQIEKAIGKGLPVFISECGLSEASGDGRTDFISAAQWFTFVANENLSYAIWSLSDKDETSAFFCPGTPIEDALADKNLTPVGKWARSLMRGSDPFAIIPDQTERKTDAISVALRKLKEASREDSLRNWLKTAEFVLPLLLAMILMGNLLDRKTKNPTYADLAGEKRASKTNILHRIVIFLSIFFTTMYLLWRILYSLPVKKGILPLMAGIILLIVEILGFIESLIMYEDLMHMRLYDVPKIGDDEYPDVDIFIATYNEDEELLFKTVNGCRHLEYPDKKKVHIWLCDDNRRPQIKRLAKKMKVGYFDRPDNDGAKAGNLNHAMSLTSSPYVVTLDADMIPRSCFLMKTIPFFVDAEKRNKDKDKKTKLGLLQTPQSFYDADVFQHALYSENNAPNEQDFFYRTIEVAKTSTNSVIYGGSNTVISREALEAIGGFYTASITEDFATGLLIESAGFVSLALPEPLASGMVPKTYQEHIKQRTRWGRGVISTARQLHIFTRKGLSIRQKLSYWSSVVYWYSPIKNLIYMLSPLLYAVLNVPILICSWSELLVFWLPMFLLQDLTLRLVSRSSISTKWSGIYETSVMPHLLLPILKELFGITLSKFKVTDKSGRQIRRKTDTKALTPFLILLIAHIAGFIRIFLLVRNEPSIGLASILFWMVRNCYFIIMSIFLIDGREIEKETVKVRDFEPVRVIEESKETYDGITTLLTEHSIRLFLDDAQSLEIGEKATVVIENEKYKAELKCIVTDVTILNYSDQRMHKLEILDFNGCFEEYLQILYDRIPTLPQSLQRDFGILRHFWRNIAFRIARSEK